MKKGAIAIYKEIDTTEVNTYIEDGYRVFIYNDQPLSIKSFPSCNPVVRPRNNIIKCDYQIEIK